ncbi:MAG: 3'-5' exonuclease, partial [Planctomycetales bacterium]
PVEAVNRYRAELMEKHGSDFIPYTYHLPVSICIAKVKADCGLDDVVVLDEPEFRPHQMTQHFWVGWEKYDRPTFVTFNGRGFDIPVLELAAFRYGISVPAWFKNSGPSWEQPRTRYNTKSHIDLYDLVTNFGASRFNGGLNLAANLLGKPGKMQVHGYMVQELYNDGDLKKINEYCRCDVLDTYFAFLRSRVLVGAITLEEEHQLVSRSKEWITEQAKSEPAYELYLKNWGDWKNPWAES